jgi:hypothetical protein
MSVFSLHALLLLAISALSMNSIAQVAYKCGNSYSQTPCPDAVVINTNDQRTSAQKLQTDQAIQRDARVADSMEKTRLQQEAKDLAANTAAPKSSSPASASKGKTDTMKLKKRKKAPKAVPIKASDEKKASKAAHPASEIKSTTKS